MNSNEDLLKLITRKDEDPVNVKEFLFRLLRYWYWFIISGFIGLGIAYFYNKYVPSNYSVSSLVLVKEKKADGLNLDNLFDNFQLKSDVKIENHIGILTSFSINRQVVENLGWYVSWYQEMPFGDYDLFGREPYKIEVDPSGRNLTEVPLYIKSLSNKKYLISVDAEVNIDGKEEQLNFEQVVGVGEKFSNEYFNFILYETANNGGGNYYFRFNDLNNLALSYKNKLEVTAINKNADLISLKLEGQLPVAEMSYLNELTHVYIQFGLKEKNLTSENTIRFIDRQLADIVDTLKITSDNFSRYRADNKVFDLEQKASLVLEELVELDSKKSLARMQLNYYKNLNTYLDNAEKMKTMVAPSVVGITDVTLNKMVVKLIELHGKKGALSFSLQDKNPSIQVVEKELEYTKKSLVENLKNLVYNTKQELILIQEEINEMNKQLEDYPKTEQDLINIKRMFDLHNELYTFLLQKRAEAEITKASNVPDVKVLDPASEATYIKTSPKSILNLLVGLFAALAIPFLIIIVKDYFDETIHSKEDIRKLTDIPVVGSITHSPYDEKIPVVKYPRSILTESIRELRTNLDYLYRGKESMVVGIQSVVPKEGKSFISLNLSAIIALNNKKVVLVGGDMRKPSLHYTLGISNKEGLSTYLIGHHTLDQVIKPTSIGNLDFIPSGTIPPNPSELLGTSQFDNLINELKKRYDVIVVDNSPSSLVTDGAILRRHTNIDLFIVRQGYSHKGLIDFINQLTEKNQDKKPAIVLNDMKHKKYGRYSYRYGGYYRKAYYGSSEGYFDFNKVPK